MPTAQVPQFINMESKIVGPLSLRQFLFLAGGGALIFALNFILSTGLWLLVSLFIAALAIALAFVKVNEQPLHKILLNAFKFYASPKLYTWQRSQEKKELIEPPKPTISPKEPKKRLTVEELEKLAEEIEEQSKK
ncbi:MAG: PrgI family protein [Candidatus Paceibacterota bacterium]|jgi:hypothetical protein|nr:PrgI family protein [Candidatus Pacearchaeota archaeon]